MNKKSGKWWPLAAKTFQKGAHFWVLGCFFRISLRLKRAQIQKNVPRSLKNNAETCQPQKTHPQRICLRRSRVATLHPAGRKTVMQTSIHCPAFVLVPVACHEHPETWQATPPLLVLLQIPKNMGRRWIAVGVVMALSISSTKWYNKSHTRWDTSRQCLLAEASDHYAILYGGG